MCVCVCRAQAKERAQKLRLRASCPLRPRPARSWLAGSQRRIRERLREHECQGKVAERASMQLMHANRAGVSPTDLTPRGLA